MASRTVRLAEIYLPPGSREQQWRRREWRGAIGFDHSGQVKGKAGEGE